jgi:mannan endo-1,4-beta-mannosidase
MAAVLFASERACAQIYRYEAESGQRFGTVFSNQVAGYSGAGYVTGFDSGDGSDYVQLNVDVPDGLYEMWVGYRSPYGPKGYNLRVDGERSSGMFDQSVTFAADRAGVFNVRGAANTLAVEQFWGYYDVDYLEFRPFTPPTLLPVSPQLVDAQADAATRGLMTYLTTIYGSKTLSGQQHSSSQNMPFPGQLYLNKSGGLVPAIRGSDLMEYSPTRLQHGANPQNVTEQSIVWARQTGGVVSMSWHWNAPADLVNAGDWPWWRGFYTQGTTFDLPGALANPGGPDYQLLLRDIDAIALQLQKFEDAGVPVIWRPLHEAQGGWFWWGAHGPDAFKQLWRLTYDRLANHHGLHNLIWEFTSSAAEGDHLDWYPGDDVVDMIGLDVYTDPTSSMSGPWYDILEHYNGRKLIALSETGTLPNAEVMRQMGVQWSYFSPWSGSFVDAFNPADLQALLGDEDVITLDELPAMPWKELPPIVGDIDGDGDADGADFLVWQLAQGTASGPADIFIDGAVDWFDMAIWKTSFGQSRSAVATTATPEPSAALLAATAMLACPWRRAVVRAVHGTRR